MDSLSILIPLMPLCAALIIGVGILCDLIKGEPHESFTALIAEWTVSMAFLLAFALFSADVLEKNTGEFVLGSWLESDKLRIDIRLITSGFNVKIALLFALLLAVTVRFSANYMHRESGFHRFYFILCLFSSAMLFLVLSGNAAGTFAGWEIAGLCSYLLIGYLYERPVATANAMRVFIINRVGDAGFILGIGLSYAWAESLDWAGINGAVTDLSKGEILSITFCFAIAALTKSAQLPFSPWLTRAMEGPTPSSAVFYGAVMIHSGVYLTILLQPLIDQTAVVRGLLVFSGLSTALYSYFSCLTQADVKSSQALSVSGQIGIMFIECGLGFWELASWHLAAHATVRGYLLLTAPSFIFNTKNNPVKPVNAWLNSNRWLFVASLQRFWIEHITDWALVKPIRHLAHDLSYFDDNIVNRLMGIPGPVINVVSTLAQIEQSKLPGQLSNKTNEFTAGTGFIAGVTHGIAFLVHWFEDRLVLQGIGKDSLRIGRHFGHLANKFETRVLRPRYLVLFVFITLLVAF